MLIKKIVKYKKSRIILKKYQFNIKTLTIIHQLIILLYFLKYLELFSYQLKTFQIILMKLISLNSQANH